MSPAEPKEEVLESIYGHRFSAEEERRERWREGLWRVLVEDWFSRWIPGEATVLDYGCGNGEFINAVRAKRRIGVDARKLSEERLADGVEYIETDGVSLASVPSGSVDVVFCSNVLEHLPTRETVSELLSEFKRVLSPEGRVLILGPNIRHTGAAYWDFFDHILPLTHRTLEEALVGTGLEVEAMLPRFLPYSTVESRVLPLFLVRLYLRIPWVWRIMGAQFFAVARRPGS